MKTASVVLLLLLGAIACSTKEEVVPVPTPNTGGYTIDGRTATGTAKAYFQGPGNGGTDDRLSIIITTSTSAASSEKVTLLFNKAPGTSETAYQLQILGLNQGLGKPYYNYTLNTTFTLVKTNTGGYSGTFSGFSPATSYPASTITQGTFTNVNL